MQLELFMRILGLDFWRTIKLNGFWFEISLAIYRHNWVKYFRFFTIPHLLKFLDENFCIEFRNI